MGIDMKITNQQNASLGKPEQTNNRAVANIQKQIQSVKDQISQLSNNTSLSPQQKQAKKKTLEDKITTLNEQLRQEQLKQKKTEEAKKQTKQEQLTNKNEAQNESKNNVFSNDEMQAMVTASTSFDNAKAINHARTQMNGLAHNLKGEIAAAKSRGGDPAEQTQQLEKLESRINKTTTKLVEEYGKANDAMNHSLNAAKDKGKISKEEDEKEKKNETIEEKELEQNEKIKKHVNIKL